MLNEIKKNSIDPSEISLNRQFIFLLINNSNMQTIVSIPA